MNSNPDSNGFALDELTHEHGRILKEIALESIRARIGGIKYLPSVDDPKLKEKAGVFVTLKEYGELRGCIGYIEPIYELWYATFNAAVHAAISDPRFGPVEEDELDSLEIEVSVLGPVERISMSGPTDIGILKLGSEGLTVEGMGKSGLLLPQVAIESGMNAMEFLEATCEKAGLEPDAWKYPNVSVNKFTARVF